MEKVEQQRINMAIVYARDENGCWHSTAATYPAHAKTSCCNKKIPCVQFASVIDLAPGQHKCPELINKEHDPRFLVFRQE